MRRGLVVAAHGSGSGSEANLRAQRLAAFAGARTGADTARAAFHLGEPPFARVLDELACDRVVVVPLMTSRGYYCDEVLPRELALNRGFSKTRVRITRPVGVDPGVASIVRARARALRDRHRLDLPRIVIVGHGTERSATSRLATEELVRRAGQDLPWYVEAAFLDEEPGPESVVADHPGTDLIVVPFFVGSGRHVERDIRGRIGAPRQGASPGSAAGRVVVDRPVGEDPAIDTLVVKLALGEDGCTSSAPTRR